MSDALEAPPLEPVEREVDGRALLQMLDAYYRGTRKAWLTALIVPLLVVAVFWQQVDGDVLLGWLLLVMAGIGARQVLCGAYFRAKPALGDPRRWGRRATALTLYLGVLWGASTFLFHVEGSLPHQTFLITINLLLGICAVGGGIYWFPAFPAYATPILGAVAVRLAMEGDLAHVALAMLVGYCYLMCYLLGRRLNGIVSSEMRLRHGSEALSLAYRQKSEEALQATQAKSRFMAAASHDLRQPLHALVLFMDLLKGSTREEERRELLPRIDFSLGALSKLFDALLDISRLDSGTIEPNCSRFDVREFSIGWWTSPRKRPPASRSRCA